MTRSGSAADAGRRSGRHRAVGLGPPELELECRRGAVLLTGTALGVTVPVSFAAWGLTAVAGPVTATGSASDEKTVQTAPSPRCEPV